MREAQMFYFFERNKMKLSWLCLLVIQGDKQIKLPNIRDTSVRRCNCETKGQDKRGKGKPRKTQKEILRKNMEYLELTENFVWGITLGCYCLLYVVRYKIWEFKCTLCLNDEKLTQFHDFAFSGSLEISSFSIFHYQY